MPGLTNTSRNPEFQAATLDGRRRGEEVLAYFGVQLSGVQLARFRAVMENWAKHEERTGKTLWTNQASLKI